MRNYKVITTEKEVLDKIYCNKCSREILRNREGYFADHLFVEKKWGYGSVIDGEEHSFDLCEECYIDFIKSFKINPSE